MARNTCEYDDTPLVHAEFDPFVHGAKARAEGRVPEDACPACAEDIARHRAQCKGCDILIADMEDRE